MQKALLEKYSQFYDAENFACGFTFERGLKAIQCNLNLGTFRLDHNGRCLRSFLNTTSAMNHHLMLAYPLIEEWLYRVEQEPDLTCIPLNFEERTGHLPHLIHDVISRLRLDAGTKAPLSKAAAEHGDLRRKQGYTVAMMIEESRLLQVSIFTTLHNNVTQLEFSSLLPDVVTIADEVDAQLKEQMLLFMAADAAKKAKGK